MNLKVFVDSDVVISSFISQKGAAHYLINEANIERLISNRSKEEIERVVSKLDIGKKEANRVLEEKFSKILLKDSLKQIKHKYLPYVKDPNDAHIVAGAHIAKVKFIISYNQRDYNSDKIKENLNIIMMTPANFLQYLRSLE